MKIEINSTVEEFLGKVDRMQVEKSLPFTERAISYLKRNFWRDVGKTLWSVYLGFALKRWCGVRSLSKEYFLVIMPMAFLVALAHECHIDERIEEVSDAAIMRIANKIQGVENGVK